MKKKKPKKDSLDGCKVKWTGLSIVDKVRNQALEEAAKAIEATADSNTFHFLTRQYAEIIRALKVKP